MGHSCNLRPFQPRRLPDREGSGLSPRRTKGDTLMAVKALIDIDVLAQAFISRRIA
jgi:hypothetical protein